MNINTVNKGVHKHARVDRVGRGPGSGNGKTAGRGMNGQRSRAGSPVSPLFEGGQLPLYRQLPKRGFNNRFATVYSIVNVKDLNSFEDGDTVNLEKLMAAGIVRKPLDGLKVLGNGEITKKLTVEASVFSAAAKEKIEAAGGKTEVK